MNAGEGSCTVPVISHFPPVIFNEGKGICISRYIHIFIVPRCGLINYRCKIERQTQIFVG
jgi:hypothetical protein